MSPSSSELSTLFHEQHRYFASGQTREIGFRREKLLKLSESLLGRTDQALEALTADLGKPPLESWLSEVHFIRSELKHCIRKLPAWAKPQKIKNPFYFWPARSEIRHEPLGQSLIAAPWNYPIQLALSPLISAVAAGNCVTLKPSELAPASSRFLAELVAEVFDRGHVAVVEGGPQTAASLLEMPFDQFSYTGGAEVGQLYARAAAVHLAPLLLELGGKCPCIIDSSVDLERVVERIINGKLFNAGQTCVAPDHVFVPADLHDRFIELATREIEACYGSGQSRDLAHIVNRSHYQRLLNMVEENGIRIGEDNEADLYFAPRVLPHADRESAAMKEEIFGPILPVIGYQSLEELLEQLLDHPDPLAIYIFSRNRRTQEVISRSMRSGAVCINDVMKTATNHFLPMGGVGRSGLRNYRGEPGFRNFSYQRAITRRSLRKDLFLTKPPFGKQLDRLRRFLER